MGKNRQLVINMLASVVSFITGVGVNFFLTPYIVNALGSEAFGFVSLSTNIISYTTLLTIALNAMAARFITINYVQGNLVAAKKYFSSVFYSNVILCSILVLVMVICVINLEYILKIPAKLLVDVKILFSLLAIGNIIGWLCNVYGVATYIKNRLDLSSVQGIISNVLRALFLVLIFAFFPPYVWYIGASGLLVTIYFSFVNYYYTSRLTPELKVKWANFDFEKVKELLKSGVWNLISKLGDIIGEGFDLLIANVCIGVTAMGIFSLTRSIPFQILAVIQMIAGIFSPVLINLYAQNKTKELKMEFLKTIRILGFLSTIPLAVLYLLGEEFYSLWLPTQDASKLYMLTILSTINFIFSLPLNALWNVFTITNRLKYSTLVVLGRNVFVFLIVLSSMFFVESQEGRLLVLASARSFIGIIFTWTFLPMYGAYCLNFEKTVFYMPLIKSAVCMGVVLLIGLCVKQVFLINSWSSFVIVSTIITLVCIICNLSIILTPSDRQFILSKFLKNNR